ncbi:MAG: type II toxin-antitoxin system VapC family toxin [Candidatus Limnocylindria bacterium]
MNAPRPLVIDASAALAVVLNEDQSDAVQRVTMARVAHSARIVVPELFWIEISNALVRRHRQPFNVVLEVIATLDGLGLTTVQTDRAGLLAATAAMLEHKLSGYDATYLALAHAVDASLLTLDRRLATAAGDRAVILDPGEVRETRPPYRLEPWITWDDAASYFKAVREVTLEEARR